MRRDAEGFLVLGGAGGALFKYIVGCGIIPSNHPIIPPHAYYIISMLLRCNVSK